MLKDKFDILIKGGLLNDLRKICTEKIIDDFFSTIQENNIYDIIEYACLVADNSYDKNDIACPKNIKTRKLGSVFNYFGDNYIGQEHFYQIKRLDSLEKFNYPLDDKEIGNEDDFEKVVNSFLLNINKQNIFYMEVTELLRILECDFSYIPYKSQGSCDISLYIHSKITAAIASCMYQYFTAEGITDYKKYCFTKENETFRSKQAFLLVSGDFSGIQNFIYTIPSKGALKSLRGRSFYLEIFMENFIDEILAELHLSRANLLYTGGGHFYLLAANTEQTKAALQKLQAACNTWLLENFGTQLYMAIGYAACSAEVLQNSGAQRSAFAAVSRELNKDKQCRYGADNLAKLFDSESVYNKNLDGSRECSICHLSSTELIKSKISDGYVCPRCKGLFELGENLFKKDIFVVLDTELAGSIELFGTEKKLYLTVMNKLELEKYAASIVRIYSKNEAITGGFFGTRLWLADYYTPDKFGGALEFNELAEQCCDDGHGIKRLGVLRADVDNLGAAFIGGFIRHGADNPEKYATLSRYADLSRDLGLFFKVAVNKICQGELTGFDINDKQQAFSLFALAKDKQRKVHVVYSGGDDMFIVGAWDELLELAVDIRRAFAKFTNGKLTFSAGLAMFTPSYPISKMAEITGMLESAAKDNDKNSIALFGFDTEQHGNQEKLQCKHIYHWQDFTDKVCAEKLDFLIKYLGFANEQDKLKAGMSMLYRLHSLIEEAEKDKVNIARFAYTLGRMQPGDKKNLVLQQCYEEFSQQMYKWYINVTDRKQLFTAIDLLIYYRRESKEA